MAGNSNKVVPVECDAQPADVAQPIEASPPPDLPLFRFRLRHVLSLFAAASLLLALLVSLDGITALALLLAVLVVVFHVSSTALGSQLRLYANRPKAPESATSPSAAGDQEPPHASNPLPMPTAHGAPWYARSGTAPRWVPQIVAIAAFFGGCVGAAFLAATIGHRTSLAGLVVGTFSLAALSGLFAFLAVNFFGTVRGGFSEAAIEHDSPSKRP